MLAVQEVCFYVGGNFLLPLVSVEQQLLLVIEQLLVGLSGKLEVWALVMTTSQYMFKEDVHCVCVCVWCKSPVQ